VVLADRASIGETEASNGKNYPNSAKAIVKTPEISST
jgi:hypothetical protein